MDPADDGSETEEEVVGEVVAWRREERRHGEGCVVFFWMYVFEG
jgi:hypothetical protein